MCPRHHLELVMGSIKNFGDVFCLTNAPTTFMSLVNGVFNPFLDSFMIVIIDDILVYSKSEKDHVDHLRIDLGVLGKQSCTEKFLSLNFG